MRHFPSNFTELIQISPYVWMHIVGERCPVCGSTIERVLVQNRGTCFCPTCQPFGSGPLI